MRTAALCLVPAALLVAFIAAFIRTFRPTPNTDSTEGEQ